MPIIVVHEGRSSFGIIVKILCKLYPMNVCRDAPPGRLYLGIDEEVFHVTSAHLEEFFQAYDDSDSFDGCISNLLSLDLLG
jgi:hypothetical protein